ncbi:MAG: hypothetical protein RI964_2873, partial [Pseudomonadota bacterium]
LGKLHGYGHLYGDKRIAYISKCFCVETFSWLLNTAGESCASTYTQATTSSSSNDSWDGVSPSGTACEADATTVASASNSYGKVELRWSNTCKTNWTRVIPNSSSHNTYGRIRRTSDGRTYTTSGTGVRFTAMVFAPTVQACASGTINGYGLSEVCR